MGEKGRERKSFEKSLFLSHRLSRKTYCLMMVGICEISVDQRSLNQDGSAVTASKPPSFHALFHNNSPINTL